MAGGETNLWHELTEMEREVLNALFLTGASPRVSSKKASVYLLFALHQRSPRSKEAEGSLSEFGDLNLRPPADELDRALVDLVKRPRTEVRLVDGFWGDWSHPCHPAFRECRLSRAGQRLLVEVARELHGVMIPKAIEDEVLGCLEWNPPECWWERQLRLASGGEAQLSLFQEIPGAPVELAAARSTLSGILKGQERFCKVIAARAREPDNWILERSAELPKLVRETLEQSLAVRSLLLDAAGGGAITCGINGWDEYKVVVEVDARGRLDEVTVVDFA